MSNTGEVTFRDLSISTGSTGDPTRTTTDYRVIVVPIDRYEVKVIVGPRNEFIAIAEISARRDFRSYDQRMANVGVHDVNEFYKE